LTAYQMLTPGEGHFMVVRVWEVQLMAHLGIVDEDAYASIPVATRARMISAREGPKMVSALDQHRMHEKMRESARKKHAK